MLDVLNRGSGGTILVDRPERTDRGAPPPPVQAPPPSGRGWPRRAVGTVAVLGVLALGAATAAIVQWVDDDSVDVSAYEQQIADLINERDDLAVENDQLGENLANLEAELAQLQSDLAERTAQLDATAADLEQALADLDGVRDDAATISAALAAETERVRQLEAANDTLSAELDAVRAMFPLAVKASLVGHDVVGVYSAAWVPVYNYGLADITLPGVRDVRIGHTPEGWLDVTIPGAVEADLLRADGALTAIVDSTSIVAPVNGVARTARVTITIYAAETVTDQAGATTISKLGMAVSISAPAVDGAPAGVALYGAVLTPHG